MRTALLLISAGFTVLGCSQIDDDTNANLIGEWQWESSSGGIAGTIETPESKGETRKLEITTDSIKSYLDGTLTYKTKYRIETQESLIFNEPREMIIQQNGFREIMELNGNKLILTGDCNDCFTTEYSRE